MNPSRSGARQGVIAGALALAFPTLGRAMTMDTAAASWLSGAVHPVLEYTHFVALLGLGAAAALLGRRSSWGLPIMTAVLMAFGAVLGTQGAVVPRLDTIVLTTALCLTLLILGQVHLPFAVVATGTGAFALFHGVADGILMNVAGFDVSYAFGFAVANVTLMVGGVMVGTWIHHSHASWVEYMRHWRDHMHGLRFGS